MTKFVLYSTLNLHTMMNGFKKRDPNSAGCQSLAGFGRSCAGRSGLADLCGKNVVPEIENC